MSQGSQNVRAGRRLRYHRVPTPSCYEDRVDMGWLCFSGTHTSTCGLKTHEMLTKGKRKEQWTVSPKEAILCRQREVRNQEMSPINRPLWARRGVEGGNSVVCGEHARGYEI